MTNKEFLLKTVEFGRELLLDCFGIEEYYNRYDINTCKTLFRVVLMVFAFYCIQQCLSEIYWGNGLNSEDSFFPWFGAILVGIASLLLACLALVLTMVLVAINFGEAIEKGYEFICTDISIMKKEKK